MAIEVKLPDLGEGIEAGDVLALMVKEGDRVERDQGILEIETDKATVEVPSPDAGFVKQIHVATGQTIKVGAVLVTLEGEAAAGAAAPAAPAPETEAPSPPPTPEPSEGPASAIDAAFADAGPAASPDPEPAVPTPPPAPPTAPPPAAPPVTPPVAAAPAPQSPAAQSPAAQSPAVGTGKQPLAAGPAIRRFAREVGVDLTHVKGSGDGGRITREDVLEVVRHANRVAHEGATDDSRMPTPGAQTFDEWGPVSIEDAPRIRQTIAAKMHESWSTVPRVTNFDDADVTELEKIRQASKADYAAKGVKLTSMPFLVKAVSMALRQHPLINASYDMENRKVIYKRYVNVGIAVDTDRGLMVPSLRKTDDLSISETARELAQLSEKARSGKIQLEDLRGGTFTISNLGAIGGTYSTPIVNVPEVAILLVGRSRKLPVVVDDEVAIRLMMPLSLSYDHRLVDGATAARFLNDVIGYLEEPGRLLLAP